MRGRALRRAYCLRLKLPSAVTRTTAAAVAAVAAGRASPAGRRAAIGAGVGSVAVKAVLGGVIGAEPTAIAAVAAAEPVEKVQHPGPVAAAA